MRPKADLPAVSGRIMAAYVEVSRALEEEKQSIRALREFLEHKGPDQHIGPRVLACILEADVVMQKLVKLAIEVASEEM